MQDVSFLIRRQQQASWLPIIQVLETEGYEVLFRPVESKVTVVLSGTYLNPLAIHGRKILIAHPMEWGTLWHGLYQPVLEAYYDQVIAIDKIPLDRLIKTIRGILETSESRSKD